MAITHAESGQESAGSTFIKLFLGLAALLAAGIAVAVLISTMGTGFFGGLLLLSLGVMLAKFGYDNWDNF